VRQLLANAPIRIVLTLHGTSVELTERTRAMFITDHSNTHSRRACSTPPNRSAKMIRLGRCHVTHGSGNTALITTASDDWVLLSVVYHYVLAQRPSPEAAKIAISRARRNGQLRLRAEVREHEARPDLTLSAGERPPQIQPKRAPDQPILAGDEFGTWDWERSYATRRDATTKSLFEYVDIVANRDDVLGLWPSAELTVTAATPETAMTKPEDVSGLVWAVQGDAGGRALSISQFCARNNISRSFFYKLKKRRKAPRIMDVDGRQLISPEAERDWRLERERETTAARRLTPHIANPTKDEEDLGSK
jgi:hypothetical protein